MLAMEETPSVPAKLCWREPCLVPYWKNYQNNSISLAENSYGIVTSIKNTAYHFII